MHFIILNENDCKNGGIQELDIGLTMDEGLMMTKEKLLNYFTIDVPIIVNVSKWYQAVLRNYDYIPIGDQIKIEL
jgi:hypothetical protein